ncbi:hypothetical protein WA026_018096 [Henosepilachna vigintioctopunctata]|uniref:cystathionine gamma-lyase n=1 Tax=Henosepilachna vigintioctopunctata TaxID=420089 RepID=A0AAW1UPK5_9CUCU
MGDESGFLPYPKGFATAVCQLTRKQQQYSTASMVFPEDNPVLKPLDSQRLDDECLETSVGSPARDILEKTLAHLENGRYGVCFSSGSSAISTCISLLNKSDHVICVNDIYGGTRLQLEKIAKKYGVETTFVDIEAECFEKAVQSKTKMIWIESPTNPSLHVLDIEAISRIAKEHNLILTVDNTFLSPYLQRPLNFGADICIHSMSKYLNGHSDVIMGAIITNHEQIYKDVKLLRQMKGDYPSNFSCSQVLTSLATLPLRMRRHCENSMMIAQYLENHPKVDKVIHPGLPSHPKYELTKKQTSGHSGIITIYLKGNFDTTKKFVKGLKVIMYAASLGDYATLVEIPSRLSHEYVSPEDKKKLNYTDNMIRISVGLEDPEDLIEDLREALAEL